MRARRLLRIVVNRVRRVRARSHFDRQLPQVGGAVCLNPNGISPARNRIRDQAFAHVPPFPNPAKRRICHRLVRDSRVNRCSRRRRPTHPFTSVCLVPLIGVKADPKHDDDPDGKHTEYENAKPTVERIVEQPSTLVFVMSRHAVSISAGREARVFSSSGRRIRPPRHCVRLYR